MTLQDTTQTTTAAPKSWREVIKIHPAAELFPLMSEAELRELGEDIKKNGLRYPIILWEGPDGTHYLLDGRNRLDAMESAGISVFDDDGKLRHWSLRGGDPHELAVSLNVHRRHLNVEQRQELLITVIARKPELSNRQIAKKVGVTDKTIAAARAKAEQLRRIPQLEKTVGADGKARKQPAKRKAADKPEHKAPPVKDTALHEFNGHVLRLLQMTSKAKPERFAKTSVNAADLSQLGRFLAEVAGTHRAYAKAAANKIVEEVIGIAAESSAVGP